MELRNSRIDHPDHLCDKTYWGVAVGETINSSVELICRICYVQVMDEDVIHAIGIIWIELQTFALLEFLGKMMLMERRK